MIVQLEATASEPPMNLRAERTSVPQSRPPLCKTALDTPTEVSERLHLAAQQDLEFKSSLAVARHHIENLLAAFSHAVATRDEDSLAMITHTTRISVQRTNQASKGLDVRRIIDWLAPRD